MVYQRVPLVNVRSGKPLLIAYRQDLGTVLLTDLTPLVDKKQCYSGID